MGEYAHHLMAIYIPPKTHNPQVEYIVSDELTFQVLTDVATFSFELGTAKVSLDYTRSRS